MKTLARSKPIASILVCAGFAVWLIGTLMVGGVLIGYLIGSAAFFLVACFLPETRRTTFLSRRSSLSLVGLFTALAANLAFTDELRALNATENATVSWTLSMGLLMILGVVCYWLSIFLIRGFRARPEYENEGGEEPTAAPNRSATPTSHSTSSVRDSGV